MKRRGRVLAGSVAAMALGLQFLPLGHARTNPPITTEVEWPDSMTRTLFYRACGDCHSNRTEWPWYSAVAPASWLVTSHVRHGRGTLNVSEWSEERFGAEARESGETIRRGTMPLAAYLRLHRDARLSEAERDRLARGLDAVFGTPGSD